MTYRCAVHDGAAHKAAGVRHVSIRCSDLDRLATDAVISALLFSPTTAVPDPEADELVRLTVDLGRAKRARSRLLELILEEKAGEEHGAPAADVADVVAHRATLARQVVAVEQRRAALIQRNAQADLLSHIQAQMNEVAALDGLGLRSAGPRFSIDRAATVTAELEAKFATLALEQRRILVRACLDVTVANGRGLHRVHIKHKSATDLNGEKASC